MKKSLLTLSCAVAACVLTPALSFAEDEKPKHPDGPGRGERDPAARLKMMTEKLGLSDDQQAKIKAIFEKTAPKAKEIMDNASLPPEEKRAKMMELRKSDMEEVRAILTPEQQQKMKEMRSPGGGPGGPGGRGGPGHEGKRGEVK